MDTAGGLPTVDDRVAARSVPGLPCGERSDQPDTQVKWVIPAEIALLRPTGAYRKFTCRRLTVPS
jgi:hypothetical protein